LGGIEHLVYNNPMQQASLCDAVEHNRVGASKGLGLVGESRILKPAFNPLPSINPKPSVK
jgi:hypothetical protein